jgi:enoyl-[acyl-carrier protein] reductase II
MRVVRNNYTAYFEDHPEELQPFPAQIGRSMKDGAFHLGGGPDTQGVHPDMECYPSGQGVGAIDDLVPAGTLVTRIVAQAERVLADLART